MKPQDHTVEVCRAKITPRHPVAALLSASIKYIVTGLALAGAAMHPDICVSVLAEPDWPDSASEPPAV